jgi:GH43 family beta-xylosidase
MYEPFPFISGMLLVLTVGVLAVAAQPSSIGTTYTNPIIGVEGEGGADPAVLLHNDTYYFYSTNTGNHVFISQDLVHWEKGPSVLPEKFKGAWAPEVYYHPEDNKFYMYYTMKYKIGVAVADKPDTMFTDLGILAVPGIDAHLFRDDDARLYLYFTHTPPFAMHCVPMKSPHETGGPVTKCFEISQDWEKHHFPINEGPWMEKRDGKYTLLYCGSDGQSIYYAIGAAFAPTPLGPFTKYNKNPVFQDLPKIYCPGHGSVTQDRTGALWFLYHQKPDSAIGWKRDICLDPMAYDESGVLRGKPTRGEARPAPVCDPDVVWAPDIHPRGAIFNNNVMVTLTSRTAGAVIRYTLDGSEPGPQSLLYEKPLVVDKTIEVKTRAYKEEMRLSATTSQHFTRTAEKLPENPSPNAPAGEVPFDVFPRANLEWGKHMKKPTDEQKK